LKSHLFAILMALGLVASAAAQQRQVPINVSHVAAREAGQASHQWSQFVAYVNGLPPGHRAGHVNLVVNGLRYQSDLQATGEEDHWDTPLEFLGRGAGDCEDFAIAKYFLLLESGVAPELVKLAFVFYTGDAKAIDSKATRPKRTHVVVLLSDHVGDRQPLVLDALPHVVPLSEREDLHLVFDFGADGNYASAVSEQVASTRSIERMLTQWNGVLERMREAGGAEAVMLARANRNPAQQLAQLAGSTRLR
jgi:predicted transglutaminase-like cysteine proteinase